jgi:predicted phosphodiesterase
MKIGFVSDIHEDIESLRAAFTTLEKLNCDSVVCLGDVVGFTLPFQRFIERRDANACLAMVRDQCSVVVAGNHDLYAVKRIPEYAAGFQYRDNWYELEYEARAKLSRNQIWLYDDSELPQFLTSESVEYLQSLPEYATMTFDGISFLFSHFHHPDFSGSRIDSLRKAKHLKSHFQFMTEKNCKMSFSGHGHPEGCACSDENKLKFFPFGSYQIEQTLQWIVCPCVANTSRANGIMSFDTSTYQLDVIPLRSRKSIV